MSADEVSKCLTGLEWDMSCCPQIGVLSPKLKRRGHLSSPHCKVDTSHYHPLHPQDLQQNKTNSIPTPILSPFIALIKRDLGC